MMLRVRLPAAGARTIQPVAILPSVDAGEFLSGAQFSDAYTLCVGERLSARQAAERMLGQAPSWVGMLMAVRDRIVSPFGIKTGCEASTTGRSIGIFPIVSETADRLVVGLDDRHLDFRVIVDVVPAGAGCRVTATTIVLTHGLQGRLYLATILPFHRLIVRTMLAQAVI